MNLQFSIVVGICGIQATRSESVKKKVLHDRVEVGAGDDAVVVGVAPQEELIGRHGAPCRKKQDRADSKRYPAIDPIDSYSKYLEYEEVRKTITENISAGWLDMVESIRDLLIRGKETRDQINILGDDGLPVEHHIVLWKSELIDFVILQQDGFDEIDRMSPITRQKYMLEKVTEITGYEYEFNRFEEVAEYFRGLINLLRQMNYSEFNSEHFRRYEQQINELIGERRVA